MGREIILAIGLLLAASPAQATERPLNVAISLDIPPYVMDGATDGLEVALVRRVMDGRDLRFIPMPYSEIETAIARGVADIAVAVQQTDASVFYSDPFVTFVNFAISKRADGLSIAAIPDLGAHRVLTWQGAWMELGDAFASLFAPGAPFRANYAEIADQSEQVRQFWEGDGAVIVIDRAIFQYFSAAMGRTMDAVVLHDLFPPNTDFRVGFADAALRDDFNTSLAGLCRGGEYAQLLDRFGIVLQGSVCDR